MHFKSSGEGETGAHCSLLGSKGKEPKTGFSLSQRPITSDKVVSGNNGSVESRVSLQALFGVHENIIC